MLAVVVEGAEYSAVGSVGAAARRRDCTAAREPIAQLGGTEGVSRCVSSGAAFARDRVYGVLAVAMRKPCAPYQPQDEYYYHLVHTSKTLAF